MSNNSEKPADNSWAWIIAVVVISLVVYQCSKESAYDKAYEESYQRTIRENRHYQEQQKQRDHEDLHRASEIIFGK